MNYANINNWLEGEIGKLDISPTNYKKAVDRYTAVGNMIETRLRDEYNVDSHVYAQGSFMLGTVVQPYGKDKEYDVDLVCECDFTTQQKSPLELKKLIGKIISEDSTYGKMLTDEGRRTWTIEYAEDCDLSFHIDVQPSIPGEYSQYEKAILTTTKSKENQNDYSWDNGNPLGLKDWFDSINASSYNEIAFAQKRMLFESNNLIYASVDEIPKQLVVTKLQRMIQILKRHRDIRFENKDYKDDKPNSMIITILASKVFSESNGNASLSDLLKLFADKVSTNVELLNRNSSNVTGLLIDRIDGRYEISNPTVEENLAERWNDSDNSKKRAFFDWTNWIHSDVEKLRDNTLLFEYEKRSFDSIVKDFSSSKTNTTLPIISEPKELENKPQPWKDNV